MFFSLFFYVRFRPLWKCRPNSSGAPRCCFQKYIKHLTIYLLCYKLGYLNLNWLDYFLLFFLFCSIFRFCYFSLLGIALTLWPPWAVSVTAPVPLIGSVLIIIKIYLNQKLFDIEKEKKITSSNHKTFLSSKSQDPFLKLHKSSSHSHFKKNY